MSLPALPTALLIPPANCATLGAIALALWPRWPRLGRALTVLAMLGLVVFSLPVTGRALIRGLEAGLPRAVVPGTDPPQAIVILSADAGYGGKGGLLPGSGIGRLTLDRMRAGAVLARRTGLPVLASGGVLEHGAAPIAAQMATAMKTEFGVKVRWAETRSESTWQNARFSAVILRHAGIRSVYLVTQAWHEERALVAFRRAGLHAVAAPVRFSRAPSYYLRDFLPHASAWQLSYWAMHEWIGWAYYLVRP